MIPTGETREHSRTPTQNSTPMDDVVSSPPETNIRKRSAPEEDHPDCQKPLNLKGNQFIMPTPPDTEESSTASPDASINNDEKERAASPAPSSVLSSVMEVMPSHTDAPASSSATAVPGSSTAKAANSTSGPPAKRRKLTPSDKLEAAQAKEAKAREKAEQKALKEEEKARKDEEKARKEEEKAKLQVLKDEDKRLKDEEKRQKAEEKVCSQQPRRPEPLSLSQCSF